MSTPDPAPPAPAPEGQPANAPDYHVMVLLVDDQAMVCEAVRRALANQAPLCQNAAAATPSPGERKESQVPGTTNLIRARK